jgi:hypothetical protein
MARDLARRAALLNSLRSRLDTVVRELMTEHGDKGAQWVISRKRELDYLESRIKRLETPR